jgi:tetratricopeptide (TPR) repeat protein
MKQIYFLLLILPFLTTAQTEDEACLPPNKKVLKLLETANKAQDIKTASENYTAALQAAPDNAMVYYEYAMFAYATGLEYYKKQPSPALGDKSMQKAEDMFRKALEQCSDYHADCFYYLGVINFTQKDNKEALQWFKAFQTFKHSDVKRYSEDHDKRLKDVKEVLADL